MSRFGHMARRALARAGHLNSLIALLGVVIVVAAISVVALQRRIDGWISERSGTSAFVFYEVDDDGEPPYRKHPDRLSGDLYSLTQPGAQFHQLVYGDKLQAGLGRTNLRNGPSPNYGVVGILRDGDCLSVVKLMQPVSTKHGGSAGWLKVVTAECSVFWRTH